MLNIFTTDYTVFIKGAGDLASGIALRLHHAGFNIIMSEIAKPLSVRRTVCFSEAVYDGSASVEDVEAVLISAVKDAGNLFRQKKIPVIVDENAGCIAQLKPAIVIDAIMAKRNTGTKITDAPAVIAIGPGFTTGVDAHAVIETKRGHTLGRVITSGAAIPNTGVPGDVEGFTIERLLRTGASGIFSSKLQIGMAVKKGDLVAECGGMPIIAQIDGILRGLLHNGIYVEAGTKCGDIDARCDLSACFTVSDKALSVAGGVLEAILFVVTQGIGENK